MKNKVTEKQFGTIIGVDLGDKKHAIFVTDKDGNILREFSITNRPQSLEQLAGEFPAARIAMEVGTHSPWISRLLENRLGCDVTVANARKLRAISDNDRKCDRHDARMPAKLLRIDPDLLHPIRHGSEQARQDLLSVKLRDTLVRSRVIAIGSLRASLKSLGVRLPSPSTSAFARQARVYLSEHPEILASVEPMLQAIDEISAQIKHYDKTIARTAVEAYPETGCLQQIGGVGPLTALTFVLAMEDPWRFEDPRDVGAWLGLVPHRDQSGISDKQLSITKAGNRYLRTLLVQCAQYIPGQWGPDCDLRRQGLKLAARGG